MTQYPSATHQPDLLEALGIRAPVMAAPMAGGPSTPELVIAAARAGGLGFLAAGYKTPQQLAGQIAEVRAETERFGVNLFVPHPVPIQTGDFRAYARSLEDLARRFDVELAAEPQEDDDAWAEKVDLLVQDPVPVVSFTFGLPSAEDIARLQAAGTVTVQTVTNTNEAHEARTLGIDALAVQAGCAGGHYATLTPERPAPDLSLPELVRQVAEAVDLPILAAGGISRPDQVREVLDAGAAAVVVGTVLLRCPESGASPVHKDALADPGRTGTTVTRAFSGRPARALRNAFTDRFTDLAPLGFPALHHLTGPIRKAATAAGDPEAVNLWAGEGFRDATDEPAAVVLRRLTEDL
ncbi:nitronate monooxygenase [Kocuria coralli]|uniref:Propionate 3-nitronate monooxygenase n=1 Tax=Kocuria coralli TaxID=1461025 RepID=A0A5J5KW71_9MICC|nr:nitronate monooxygenase [Kocuria coralli]KAA9393913.1 nitronate monooxygenase [Kocuria coralli]